MKFSRDIQIHIWAVIFITLGTYVGITFSEGNIFFHWVRMIFGSMYVLFLPGYFLTRNFFQSSEIDLLERIALSFAFSISVVPLIAFYLNLAGMKITDVSIFFTIFAVIVLSIAHIIYRSRKHVKK